MGNGKAVVEGLRAGLRGELIEPGNEAYDEARKVYNGMIDKRPRLIARCADVADVISAVNFARENGLLLAIRGGGHNGAGLGICDGGLVIDLSHMKGVRVDPEKRTARVGGGGASGATWITRPTLSASPPQAALFRVLESAGSLWEAASVT